MSILDPKQDVQALQPMVESMVNEAISGLSSSLAPALGMAFRNALAGLTITIQITKSS